MTQAKIDEAIKMLEQLQVHCTDYDLDLDEVFMQAEAKMTG